MNKLKKILAIASMLTILMIILILIFASWWIKLAFIAYIGLQIGVAYTQNRIIKIINTQVSEYIKSE